MTIIERIPPSKSKSNQNPITKVKCNRLIQHDTTIPHGVGLETRFEKRLTLDLSLFSCLVGPNFFFWIHFHVDTLDVDVRMCKVSALDVR